MKVYFEYGHKCLDNCNITIYHQVVTWRWNWFFISEIIKEIVKEIKFCRKYHYKFFIHKTIFNKE